jgi:two-component system, chemotaxis family, CheB/CheR fusion protein
MVIIGHHNLAHDAPFARMHLIMCREPLFSCTYERQHELIRMFAFSLAPRHGYLILGRSENITLSSLSFRHITETMPIYQSTSYASSRKTAVNDSPASFLKQLLHYKGVVPEGGVTPPPPLSLQEVLFRLAPNGIIVIDRTYRIITANRAAHRLCSLPEQTNLQDFLHSVPGLPYASVRSAIDIVFCEGNTQNVPEVELTLTHGGNGRVLSMHICLLPAEVTTPDYVVIYLHEVTEQTIIKQAHHNTLETFQNLQLNYATLTQKYTQLTQNHAQLQKTSAEILSLYEELMVSLEECQAAKEALEQDQAALQQELETVCAALLLNQVVS